MGIEYTLTNELSKSFVINDKKFWFRNGLLHREDGPAVVGISSNTKEWFLFGIEYTEEEFEVILKLKAFW